MHHLVGLHKHFRARDIIEEKIFTYPLNSGELSFFNTPVKEELSDCFLQAEGKSLKICDQGQMVFHPSVLEKFSTENEWVKPYGD